MLEDRMFDMSARTQLTIRKLRLVAGCALIGSVVTGVTLGWYDFSFDPRTVGAGLGALAGLIKVFHLV
jgi:hypothetical protein